MQRILFTLWVVMTLSLQLSAQTFTLRGKVTDSNGRPVELATVACVSQGRVTMTSLQGEYSLTLLTADSVVVRFSMIGYKSKVRVLHRPRGRMGLQVTLIEDDQMLGEVQVQGKRVENGQMQEVKTDQLSTAPTTTGNGVEDVLQTQAGVSTHSELSSQYNVRGGAFDENAVYINDVEVYRPFLVRSGQQEGLSIIHPEMVGRVAFSTGGFDAKYGDKMSSALDITYRQPKSLEGVLTASLLGGGLYLGLGGKHWAWANGVRYKTTRTLLGSLDTKGEYDPRFLDYQTFFTFQPNKRWTLQVIGDVSDNNYRFTPQDRETRFGTMDNVRAFRVYFDGHERDLFRTYFGAISLTRHLTDSTQVGVIASAFSTREQETYDIQGQYWLTQTETSENLGVGTYFQHARNYLRGHVESLKFMVRHTTQQHQLEGGLTLRREHVEENATEYEMRDSAGYTMPHTGRDLRMIYSLRSRNTLSARRLELYAQDVWRFRSRDENTLFTLHYGVRFSRWSFTGESLLSPRASLVVVPAFSHNVSFRLATGLYYQAPFYKELRDTTLQADGVTVASLNKRLRSQQSLHFIAAMDYRFKVANRNFKFTTEAYYKLLTRVTPYSVSNVKVTYYGDLQAKGHVMGLDMKLFGEFVPGADSWLSFSLMDARMSLMGRSLPLPTDQRYALHLYFTDFFPGTKRWIMNLRLSLADGLPFAAPHRELDTRNFRAPAYRRADIGMSYLLWDRGEGRRSPFKKVWLGADCLNLFGISNVNSYYWVTDVTSQQFAVPNYLTGRQLNARLRIEF